jgi:hypothetical protein
MMGCESLPKVAVVRQVKSYGGGHTASENAGLDLQRWLRHLTFALQHQDVRLSLPASASISATRRIVVGTAIPKRAAPRMMGPAMPSSSN